MSSPMMNKMSMFAESTYGTANTASGGVAYMVTTDGGWAPMVAPIASDGMFAGRQAPLDETVETVIKGYESSYTSYLRTVGMEMLFRDALGTHEATPVVSNPPTTPATYSKVFNTDAEGSDSSYTIVQERFTLVEGGSNNLTRSVYSGCMIKSWGLSVSPDNPIELTTAFVAREETKTTETTNITAGYPAPASGNAAAFSWADTLVKVGDAGTPAASGIGFLRSFQYTQDNHLDTERFYLDGDSNMAQPFQMEPVTGSLTLEFDFADVTERAVLDKFREGELISVQLEATRGVYKATLALLTVHLTNVTPPSELSGSTKLSASGEIRWAPGTDAAKLTLVTEGSSI